MPAVLVVGSLLVLIAPRPGSAFAGNASEPGSWVRLDASTGAVSSVEVSARDARRVYAGTADGVFRSDDGGLTWTRWRSGLSFTLINSLALSKEPSEVVYVGTAGGGVFRSDDLGETWRSAARGAEGVIRGLSVDPFHPENAYALRGGLLMTRQGGDYWYPSGLQPLSVGALAVAPSDPNVLFAAANPGSEEAPAYLVYRSLDGGESWSLDSPQAPLRLAFPEETVLQIDPADPQVAFAGGVDGLFRRSSAGSWGAVTLRPGPPPRVRGVAIAPGDRSTVYVAADGVFYRSNDGGGVWTEAAAPGGILNRVHDLEVSSGDSKTLFAATRSGLYRSVDGGEHWLLTEQGLAPAGASGFALDPANPIHLFLNSNRGLIESASGGAVWGEPDANLADYQRTSGFLSISKAWAAAGSGVGEIFVDPANPRRILVASNGLSLSEDGGRSFDRRLSEQVNALAVSPVDPRTMFAASMGTGVLKSDDGGVIWRDSADGLPYDDAGGPGDPRTFFEVAVDPFNPSIVYAGGRYGLHRSMDGGAHWSPAICCPFRPANGVAPALVFLDGANIVSVAFDPTNPATLYIGANPGFEYSSRLYKTTDGGQTWRAADRGLPEGARTLVAVDPGNSSVVYAGTWGFGVFRSLDGGAQWEPFNAGLENLFVTSLGFDFAGRLYAATQGGLHRLQSSPPREPAPVRPIQSVEGNSFPSGELELTIGLYRTSPDSTIPIQVTFAETLPKGLTLVDATADRGNLALGPSLNSVTWTGTLAVRMSAEIKLKARVDDAAAGRTLFAQGIAFLSNGLFSLSGGSQTPGEPTLLEIGHPPAAAGATYAPAVLPIADSFVGVAAANLGASAVAPRLEARGGGGELLSATDLATLSSGGQTAFVAGVAAAGADAVLVRDGGGGLEGFFLVGDGSLNRLDGIGGRLQDAQTLFFPFGGSTPDGQLLLSIFNPDGEAFANALLLLIDGQGSTVSEVAFGLAPLGSRTASVEELFGSPGLPGGYIRLEADRPLRGFQLDVNDRSFAAAAAQSAIRSDRLRSPHFFFGPEGSTTIRVINPLATHARLKFQVIDDRSGAPVESESEIGPRAVGEYDLRELAGAAEGMTGQGWLEILVDGGEFGGAPLEASLVALSIFVSGAGQRRSHLPLTARGDTEVTFLQVAQSEELGLFQGLAMVAASGAEVVLSVYDEAGALTAARTVGLRPGERLVGLLNDPAFFGSDFQQSGGIVRMRASREVVAYSLFGGAFFLAAVQGQ